MPHPMKAILEEFEPQTKCYKQVFTSLHCLKMPTPLQRNVIGANRWGIYQENMKLPLNNILEVELFDVWGIDFMRPFPSSFGNQYILVAVDYVLK